MDPKKQFEHQMCVKDKKVFAQGPGRGRSPVEWVEIPYVHLDGLPLGLAGWPSDLDSWPAAPQP